MLIKQTVQAERKLQICLRGTSAEQAVAMEIITYKNECVNIYFESFLSFNELFI